MAAFARRIMRIKTVLNNEAFVILRYIISRRNATLLSII